MTVLTLPGDHATATRPARHPSGRLGWAKDPTAADSGDGTRLDHTFVNDLIGLVRGLLSAYAVNPAEGDDSGLAQAVAAAVATLETSLLAQIALKASLASPALIGNPTAPTPIDGDASTRIATTNYIDRLRGATSGIATLDGSGKVPSAQLPAFVDDVLEYANTAAFPGTGTAGIIYVALDTNKTFRWSGSAYVEISPSPGSTDAVTEGSTNLYFTNGRADNRIAAAVGVSVQAFHAILASLAGLSVAANKLPYGSANNSLALTDFTAFARTLLDDSDAATARGTLGLGSAATLTAGTSANNVVQLDGTGKLPAVDASQLTNVPTGTVASQAEAEAGTDNSKTITALRAEQAIRARALRPRSGLRLANNASDATNDIDVASGWCAADDASLPLILSVACVKQIDVSFAEYSSPGTASGGRASADNTTGSKWFHVFLIGGAGKNTQPFFATSLSPTLPSGFTIKRRIGSIYWTGSAIKGFVQVGDVFQWQSVAADVSTNATTTRANHTVLVPGGLRCLYWAQANTSDSDSDYAYFSNPDVTDEDAAIATNAQIIANTVGARIPAEIWVPTNASSQISSRGSGTIAFTLNAIGYRDLELGS